MNLANAWISEAAVDSDAKASVAGRRAIGLVEDLEHGKFDAALLDANLHGRPVTAVAAALLRHRIPFAFVTGYDRQALPESFRHLTILHKPFNDHQLLETVAGLVARPEGVVQLPS